MDVTIRRATPEDAAACGRICHDAFEAISSAHAFPKDFPSRDVATMVLGMLLPHPGFYGVVAEADGRVIGSNFLDERSAICGVGPITVDPSVQNSGAGRRLMESVLERAAERHAPGVRLLQDAFHNRSFSLYTRLGFRARVTTAVMQGPAIGKAVPGVSTRPATAADREACDRLCRAVHGHDRCGELDDAIQQGTAAVATRGGRISGYTTGVRFFGHTVGETNDDVQALVAASPDFAGPGFHVPAPNDALLRWCFDRGLRMVKAMTLMTIGLYDEPRGAYLPSVSF